MCVRYVPCVTRRVLPNFVLSAVLGLGPDRDCAPWSPLEGPSSTYYEIEYHVRRNQDNMFKRLSQLIVTFPHDSPFMFCPPNSTCSLKWTFCCTFLYIQQQHGDISDRRNIVSYRSDTITHSVHNVQFFIALLRDARPGEEP